MSAPESPAHGTGRYDAGLRRRVTRKGRERGCSVYIAAEELTRAGFDPPESATRYRVWAGQRGGVFVRLYKGE